ncbi:hypothetical protein TNCV_1187051 [Trichonephila clavipes]|nr:hypothetical protein TNCV_1187051 [Trichonephila clavipes]
MPLHGKELSKDLKDVIKVYKERKSQRQIAKIIGKSPATVQKIIEKFQAEGNTLKKPRTGRPPIFTDRESDEAHFWLNGYVNKQNCRIWSEANPQVYVETPLHPEKLTVWCAL